MVDVATPMVKANIGEYEEVQAASGMGFIDEINLVSRR